jgi:hypothetical protein
MITSLLAALALLLAEAIDHRTGLVRRHFGR